MDSLDVLYSVNSGYLDMMLASLLSLIKKGNIEHLRIHIITSDFSKEDYIKLENFVKKYNVSNLFFYPLEDFNIKDFDIPDWRGSQIANSLLFFDSIIGHNIRDVENVLYLDADTVVNDSLEELSLYTDDLVCAVKDTCPKSYVESLNLNTYFNSGVILFNHKLWEQEKCEERIASFIRNPECILTYPDQDILNCALKDEISELPMYFNVPPFAFLFSDFFAQIYVTEKKRNINFYEMCMGRDNACILHSYGLANIKPWSDNSINPYNKYFMQYLYDINPSFTREQVTGYMRYFAHHPKVFNALLLARSCTPTWAESGVRKLSLSIQGCLGGEHK